MNFIAWILVGRQINLKVVEEEILWENNQRAYWLWKHYTDVFSFGLFNLLHVSWTIMLLGNWLSVVVFKCCEVMYNGWVFVAVIHAIKNNWFFALINITNYDQLGLIQLVFCTKLHNRTQINVNCVCNYPLIIRIHITFC